MPLPETGRLIVITSILWVIIVLSLLWIRARGRGRKDFSLRAGSPTRGLLYGFTIAMTPQHKETIRKHPFEFAIGILLHVGVFLMIIKSLLLVLNPQTSVPVPVIVNLLLGVSVISGFILLVRRIVTPALRAMSNPDDYISMLIVLDVLIVSVLHQLDLVSAVVLLIHTAVLFFYLPMGKLKHALFFFVARGEFSARLGYRGTWPSGGN